METIGQMLGTVGHSFNITNEQGDKISLSVKINFTHATNAEIKGWLAGNRIIAGQTAWRKLGIEELKSLNGHTFHAGTIGHKVQSREEQVQNAMARGLPRKLAEFSIDNPEQFREVMENVQLKQE